MPRFHRTEKPADRTALSAATPLVQQVYGNKHKSVVQERATPHADRLLPVFTWAQDPRAAGKTRGRLKGRSALLADDIAGDRVDQGGATKRINRARQTAGMLWQPRLFDRAVPTRKWNTLI